MYTILYEVADMESFTELSFITSNVQRQTIQNTFLIFTDELLI